MAARELVPGDIVLLQTNNKASADLRLAFGRALILDESALPGESVPADKALEALPASTVLAEHVNLVYTFTLVIPGQGCGVVVVTGTATEIWTHQTPVVRGEGAQDSADAQDGLFQHPGSVSRAGLGRGDYPRGPNYYPDHRRRAHVSRARPSSTRPAVETPWASPP